MESIDDMLGRNTNCGNKEFCAGVDDDACELIEFALGVIVAANQLWLARRTRSSSTTGDLLGLPRATADLRKKKIHTKRSILIVQEALQLGDLLTEHVWGIADTSDDTDTACIGYGGSELGTSGHVHTRKHDGMVDLQKIRDLRSELL